MIKIKSDGKRDIRHYIVLTNQLNKKLKMLAIACNTRPAGLSFLCLIYVLESPKETKGFIEYIKNRTHKTTDFVGKRRVSPHYLSVDASTDLLMRKYAQNLDLAPATLQAYILEFTLNSPSFIHNIQELYNTDDRYRIIPTVYYTGEVIY